MSAPGSSLSSPGPSFEVPLNALPGELRYFPGPLAVLRRSAPRVDSATPIRAPPQLPAFPFARIHQDFFTVLPFPANPSPGTQPRAISYVLQPSTLPEPANAFTGSALILTSVLADCRRKIKDIHVGETRTRPKGKYINTSRGFQGVVFQDGSNRHPCRTGRASHRIAGNGIARRDPRNYAHACDTASGCNGV